MNISEATENIITISIGYMGDMNRCRANIAEILEELLNTGGVGKEYMESKENDKGKN